MVGVPRSGGCHTCRRRKVRCGKETPMCQRCLHDGKDCEGYERWATFVNRTSSGLQKRKRLEEAIIPPKDEVGPATAPEPASSSGTLVGISSPQLLAPTCMLHPSNPDSGLLAKYLEWYLPKLSARGAEGYFSIIVCELPKPLPVLRAAMRALAASCMGLWEGDEALKAVSLESYTEAVNLLSQSLRSPEPTSYEQLMAVSGLMMNYEIYRTTGSSAGAWESHLRGLMGMVMKRGPEGHTSLLETTLLMDIKFSSMVLSVHLTEPSPFGSDEWRTDFVEPTSKRQVRMRNLDLIFSLVALYNEEEEAVEAGQLDEAKLRRLLSKLDGIVSQLHETQLMLPRFRPTGAPGGSATERPFWDTFSASTVSSGITAMIDASACAQDMLARLRAMLADGNDESLAESVAPFIVSQGPDWHQELSQRVADAVEYMINDCGVPGLGSSLFPCRMMLNILPRSDPTYRRIGRLYARSIMKRKMRHAGNLSELLEGLDINDETEQSGIPDCSCGEDCAVVTRRMGRARWCGCPWAKKPSK
ncbi:hypothetical protein OQA88_8613 [Cercophora sp. LCS_1]